MGKKTRKLFTLLFVKHEDSNGAAEKVTWPKVASADCWTRISGLCVLYHSKSRPISEIHKVLIRYCRSLQTWHTKLSVDQEEGNKWYVLTECVKSILRHSGEAFDEERSAPKNGPESLDIEKFNVEQDEQSDRPDDEDGGMLQRSRRKPQSMEDYDMY